MAGWTEAYLNRLEELKMQHVNHIVGGTVADHDEYRHLCGIIKGFSISVREFKDLLSEVGE